jgi:hypothetical protein
MMPWHHASDPEIDADAKAEMNAAAIDEDEAADERRCCCCFVGLLLRLEALVLHADGQYCNAGADAEN